MTLRKILTAGCDGDTEIDIDLTDSEYATVQRVSAALTAASESDCEPSMFCTSEGDVNYEFPNITPDDMDLATGKPKPYWERA